MKDAPSAGDQGEFSAEDVRALLDLLSGTDVEELEVERSGARMLVRRDPGIVRAAALSHLEADSATARDDVLPDGPDAGLIPVASTLVGLFFRGREPGAEPLVREGEIVTEGQPLATIEALRVPHAVESPAAGTVERVLVDDGHPVEYGQPVMLLRPAR